jgi:NADPH-dependent 2,4-dienoyl-CoA reductase/sulfur reductase-like enzyme/rhodanese-related sulfurtransferase
MKKKIIVIGGSAAGPKAACKARRMDQEAEITIIQKSKYLSMASCGYPYYIGGVFNDRNQLIGTPTGVTRDPSFFLNAKNIKAMVETEVIKIDREHKKIKAYDHANKEDIELEYDKLVIATGSDAIVPNIEGKELDGVKTLKTMEDAEYLKQITLEKKIKNAVVIGGGLIGIETAEALQLAGIKITIIEKMNQILPFLDWEMAKLVENHIKSKGSKVITGSAVKRIIGENGNVVAVETTTGEKFDCELVLIAIGVKPNIKIAQDCGLKIGTSCGIKVNHFMQTSDPDIYSAGDCVEVTNLVNYNKVLWPMGDAANLQARIVGQNITEGNCAEYEGVLMTGICKVFDFNAGSTGLSEKQAKMEGYRNIITVLHAAPERPTFMGAKPIYTKLVADKVTGKLLGMQCIGMGDISKSISVASMALYSKMKIRDLVNLDLPYAPPFSQAIDTFISAIHVLENKWLGRMKGISCVEVKNKLNNKEDIYILDVRGKQEYEDMRLGIGENLIPLGQLRNNIDKLPKDKNKEIIVYCKISLRGYEAQSFINSLGYKNVRVMEGGIISWPFQREK